MTDSEAKNEPAPAGRDQEAERDVADAGAVVDAVPVAEQPAPEHDLVASAVPDVVSPSVAESEVAEPEVVDVVSPPVVESEVADVEPKTTVNAAPEVSAPDPESEAISEAAESAPEPDAVLEPATPVRPTELVPDKRPAPVPVTEIGKILSGVVTAVDSKEVELALRDLRTGVIYRRAIDEAQSDPTTIFSIGDTAEGIELTRDDPKSRVVLSRAWAIKTKKWTIITDAKDAGTVLEGEVTGVSGKGLVVDIGVRGFVPASHLELDPVDDLTPYVGQTLSLKVIDVDVARERVVLSRRSVLLKETRKAAHDALAALEVGSVVSGTVSSIASYGAFVDLGEVSGLVHLSECSWSRVRSAKEVVKVGDSVQVKILEVKIKKKRVSLSIRRVNEDPLAAVVTGSVLEGPVTRLVDFGAFVDLGGVEGLVHLSELAEYRVFSASDVVFPGEMIRVKVLSVNKKKRRVELSARQAANPFEQ